MSYNSQNKLIKPSFSPYKFDRLSNRYRVSLKCSRKFMAVYRSLVYSNEKNRLNFKIGI